MKKKINILAMGAESCGRFAVFENGMISISADFGDLLDKHNYTEYKRTVLSQVKTKKPDLIVCDLHPLYLSTILGEKLSNKFNLPLVKIQHHLAHVFSALGDKFCYPQSSKLLKRSQTIESTKHLSTPPDSEQIHNSNFIIDTNQSLPNIFYGIASDGTGFGLDENIWGGEVFQFNKIVPSQKTYPKQKLKKEVRESNNNTNNKYIINKIGSLEEQTLLGGDLAVQQPARMLISILNKFLPKENVYKNVKEYYSKNEFTLLFSQLKQNYNCQQTSSSGRILDAVSVFLDFAKNERKSKHEATKILEKNSTTPYQLKPEIIFDKEYDRYILQTTTLFKYLLKNISKDKKRLAATAQLYLAQGFFEIINQYSNNQNNRIFFAGGMANNPIMSSYLENNNVYTSKKVPRGDEGLSFGQIIYYIFTQ